jgi:hypothetical protein
MVANVTNGSLHSSMGNRPQFGSSATGGMGKSVKGAKSTPVFADMTTFITLLRKLQKN